MARDPVKISKDLDDNALANPIETIIGDGTENLLINADGSLNATVNNAAGASAVNIQDGGNSITVDGSVGLNTGSNTIGKVGIVNSDGADRICFLIYLS